MDKQKKINVGYTNNSYQDNDLFLQYKNYNGFNHKSGYQQLEIFDFAPKLVEDTKEYSKWEWIDGSQLTIPSNDDLKKLGKILSHIHNSDVKFAPFNIKGRIKEYQKIMKDKGIKIDIIEALYKKINVILKNMNRDTPVHGDLYMSNILKTKENKIYLVDWEYSHMGDHHYELAYFIEGYRFNQEQEKIFLDSYGDYDEHLLYLHKILVNYITVLWLYAQEKLFFSPDACLKRLEELWRNKR